MDTYRVSILVTLDIPAFDPEDAVEAACQWFQPGDSIGDMEIYSCDPKNTTPL